MTRKQLPDENNHFIVSDVAKKKPTEKELRDSQRMLQLVLDTIPVRVFWKDVSLNYLGCNRLFALDAGLSSPEEIIGQNDYQLGWREQADMYRSDDRAVIESGVPKINYEEPQTTPSGDRIWLRTSKIPLLDASGRTIGVMGTYEDITERRMQHELLGNYARELEQTNSLLNTLFNAIPDLVWLKDANGVYTRCNIRFEDLLGKPVKEIIGRTDYDFFDADFADALRAHDAAAIQQGSSKTNEEWIPFFDGHRELLETIKTPVRDSHGELIGVMGIAHDITERTLAEKALKESNELLKRVMNNIDSFIYIADIQTHELLFVNDYAIKVWGEDIIGQKCWKALQALDGPCPFCTNDRLLTSDGKPAGVYRWEFQNKENSRWYDIRDCAIQWTDGRMVRMEIATDSTERRQAEAKIKQLEKAEGLGRMAGAIAHHYNNMLAAVMGNIEMALFEMPQEDQHPETARKRCISNLQAAMLAARRASEMSGMMLAYLGQASGRQVPLDLSQVCRECLSDLRLRLPAHLTLDAGDLTQPGPAVCANADHLRQIVFSLADNAIEAIGEHQGTVAISACTVEAHSIPEANRFPVDFHPAASGYACLTVCDDGCGIAAADMDKIFDPFYSTKFTGRGLALAVVLGAVKAHDGCIAVESAAGCGSTFRVYLPLTRKSVSPVAQQKTATDTVLEGIDVLLIEDDEMVRRMTVTMLSRLGMMVHEAGDGVEGLEIFRQNRDTIRCVVCDLTMPRMNGWNTIARLRALRPDLPVVLVSGYDETQVMNGEHSEQPQAFLGKPYGKNELKEVLKKILPVRIEKC